MSVVCSVVVLLLMNESVAVPLEGRTGENAGTPQGSVCVEVPTVFV